MGVVTAAIALQLNSDNRQQAYVVCSPENPGSEGCRCTANYECDTGLICKSNKCTKPALPPNNPGPNIPPEPTDEPAPTTPPGTSPTPAPAALACPGVSVSRLYSRIQPLGDQLMVFDNKYVSQLKNKGMYPIMVAGCCQTTEFDVGIFNFLTIFQNVKQYHNFFTCKYECVPEVMSWEMVKKSDGGSIAHIGSSSTAWGDVGDDNHDGTPDSVQNGYTAGLCAEFFRIISEGGIDILGSVYTETLIRIIDNFDANADRIQCKCVQEFQLIGDPSLKIGGYQ